MLLSKAIIVKSVIDSLRSRLGEVIVWMGIPLVGAVTSEHFTLGKELIFFITAIFFAMMHVLLFNDWGDLRRESVMRPSPHRAREILFILLAAISCLLSAVFFYASLVPLSTLLIFTATGVSCSVLYSHPFFHFKENVVGASLIHLCGGILQFLLGYLVFSNDMMRGALTGIFFAAIFTAGHFIHECIDLKEDESRDIKTRAVRFGVFPTLKVAVGIFLLAHIYLFFLVFGGLVTVDVSVIFGLPLLAHIYFCQSLRVSNHSLQKKLENYRFLYRVTYGLSTAGYIISKFNLP